MNDERCVASPRPTPERTSRRGLLRGGAAVLLTAMIASIGARSGEAAMAGTKQRHGKQAKPKNGKGCGSGGTCHVFITSTTHKGNLGGLAGADSICQQRAKAAGLSGTYKAWLSDPKDTARTRFVKSPGPYRLVDGTKIASSWDDLITEKPGGDYLAASIHLTETGVTLGQTEFTWSDTQPDGRDLQGSTYHCSNWTDNGEYGVIGIPTLTNQFWTAVSFKPCSELGHLVCFQQS